MEKNTRANTATMVTAIGMVVNILLTLGKLIVGYAYSSMALVADGVHSFSDLVSDVFIMISFQLSKKPADENHNYGHGRIEVLSEVVVSAMLFVVAMNMIKAGITEISTFSEGGFAKPSLVVLLVALVSIIAKELLYWYTIYYARKLKSGAIEANAVHHRSDAISSIAVFLALGAANLLGEKWYILDPIVAIIVALYIIVVAIKILIKSFYVLIDGAVSKPEHDKIMEILNNIPDTQDPHNVRTRKIGSYIAIEFHIRVNPDMQVRRAHLIATDIEKKLKAEFGEDTFVSVHIEPVKINGEYK